MASGEDEFELCPRESPDDGISSMTFLRNGPGLLVGSWDSTVRLYDTSANVMQNQYLHDGAVLCVAVGHDVTAFSGGLDNTVRTCDMAHATSRSSGTIIGHHEAAVKEVLFNPNDGTIFSGSWDKTMCLWDPQQPGKPVTRVELPDKVLAMAITPNGQRVVVGCANKVEYVYDTRNLTKYEQRRDPVLHFQTRCIATLPDSRGYAISSVEGRVGVAFFDDEEDEKNHFAFKCHRKTVDGVEYVYPVNTLAFHPLYGTFASGGCDGIVCVWDPVHKKRLCQYRMYPTSIAAACFNSDGSKLAIAASYTYESGQKDHPPDSIWIRSVAEKEVKPKPRSGK